MENENYFPEAQDNGSNDGYPDVPVGPMGAETNEQAESTVGGSDSEVSFELPEGFEMNQEALQEFLPLAKELGLPPEAQQRAIDLHAKVMLAHEEKKAMHRDNEYRALMDDIRRDSELGGQKYSANVGKINGLFEQFGGDAVTFHQAVGQVAQYDRQAARSMYAALHKIAQAASVEDRFVQGASNGGARNFYPGLPGKR